MLIYLINAWRYVYEQKILTQIANELLNDYFGNDIEYAKKFASEHMTCEIINIKQHKKIIEIASNIKRWDKKELDYYKEWDKCYDRHGLTEQGKIYVVFDRLDTVFEELLTKGV